MPEPTSTASVYRERGRVWIRMELSEDEYGLLRSALHNYDRIVNSTFIDLLNAGEREKSRSLDWERFNDAPELGG